MYKNLETINIYKQKMSTNLLLNFTLIVFTFFLVFIYKIQDSFEVANLIFYIILLIGIANGKIKIKKDLYLSLFILVHFAFVLLSILLYKVFNTSIFDFRSVSQLLFTFQIFIFILKIDINYNAFEKWFVRFCILLGIWMVVLFFVRGMYANFKEIFKYRFWGEGIPGWPNYIAIPLVIGFFISIKNRKVFLSIFIGICAILTTSRSAILGVGLILSFNIFRYYRSKLGTIKVLLIVAIVILLGCFFVYVFIPSLYWRLFYTNDRMEILSIVLKLFIKKPFFGYGGNTLNQISIIDTGFWEHTHNWITEYLVRYGLFGLITFILVLIRFFKGIKHPDYKFMIILLLLLGLFQTYMRMFTYLFYFVYMSNAGSNKINETDKTIKPDIRSSI